MEIPKTYNPKSAEDKWYAYWLEKKYFHSEPDERKPYTIVIPPPNVTGVLHMGHMLNNTIQDVLIRRARMLGFNACWIPGTDHASIATEAKVVKLLADQGIKKTDLTREEFLTHAWNWKEKYGGIILDQLKKLGASCDWERTRFTMQPELSEAVIDVFIDLYNKGNIYRGVRMVNWDPQGLTAVSDEEVIYKEVMSRLVYVKYKIAGTENEYITIATTRPETILGDTAVCVNPEDERYLHLKGKKCIVPIVNREVPIIFDEYVDKDFGTGALKVTPAHDINDYNLGIKYHLEVIDTLNPDGTLSQAAGYYIGEDRFAVRKKIVKDLENNGCIEKIEDIKNKVGFSERTDAVIEPRLSMQWFLKMKEMSGPALENVMNDTIQLIPEKFKNTYKHWMENVHDWCISRQLWWGQRIPAWYAKDGRFVVTKTAEEALEQLNTFPPNTEGFELAYERGNISLDELNAEKAKYAIKLSDLRQDEDVLDTWFSSWLWPLTVFDPKIVEKGWENANRDLKYYYPTNDLVTAPEILFFWVARMIMAGYEYTGNKPFRNVYLTGIVRDKLGRKMSKSLGNSPDPLELIEKYGADGVRVGMLLSSPAGNDLLFDESYCEQGRNFANKVWNAFRLLNGFEVSDVDQNESSKVAIEWFKNRFNEQLYAINDHYSKYRMSDALMATYKLVWDDFCAWYLEMIKPEFIDGKAQPIDRDTFEQTKAFMVDLLKVMHPWMPFITEELYDLLDERSDTDRIIISKWPTAAAFNQQLITTFEGCKEVVTTIRSIRQQKQLSPKEQLTLIVSSNDVTKDFNSVLIKLCNLANLSFSQQKPDNSFTFLINAVQYYVPLAAGLNTEEEKIRLKKELEYNQGFLKSVQAKLANEAFVSKAKAELVELERKKLADAESKIKAIEEQLNAL